tara:strand:+ start:562 stop:726 length:165 start_codon:yes stop_codon:yes gene_type:complete
MSLLIEKSNKHNITQLKQIDLRSLYILLSKGVSYNIQGKENNTIQGEQNDKNII